MQEKQKVYVIIILGKSKKAEIKAAIGINNVKINVKVKGCVLSFDLSKLYSSIKAIIVTTKIAI